MQAPLPQPPLKPVTAVPPDLHAIGRVLGAYGLKGTLKVAPLSGNPATLVAATELWLSHREAWFCLTVRAKVHGSTVLISSAAIDVPEVAQSFKGAQVCVPRAAFPPTQAGEYYWADLIGLEVVNAEGVALGKVVGLIETGGHDVLRVELAPDRVDASERLIPFVSAFLRKVDVPGRQITVDWHPDD